MQIDLSSLTYIEEMDLFKIILSSADYFPGLYRISTSWKQNLEQDSYLKLLSFLEIAFQSEKGQKFNRDEWFKAHEEFFNLSYGKESRNEQRAEDDVKLLLKNKGYDWYTKPKSFSLALIDGATPVTQIEKNKTYYMMGSLLRFEEDRFLVSHDDFTGESVLNLNISFDEASRYIQSTFSTESLKKLFLPAQIVAQLDFDEEDEGTLNYDMASLDSLFERFPPNCPLFASVNRQPNLPIRFAKLIGVSNVLA